MAGVSYETVHQMRVEHAGDWTGAGLTVWGAERKRIKAPAIGDLKAHYEAHKRPLTERYMRQVRETGRTQFGASTG